MSEALELAKEAFKIGEVPVGAVIVKDEKIIGRGYNRRETNHDISSHAEIEALKDAAKNLGDWRLSDCRLYVTLEPCLMCAAAIAQARISTVIYGADDLADGAISSHVGVYDDPSIKNRPLIYKGVLENECSSLLKEFFKNRRNSDD